MRHCLRGVTHRKEARSMKRNLRVKTMILDTIKMQKGLFAAILFAVTGAIISALLPPLVLARIIDGITAGDEVSASFLLLYFLLLALTGFLEAAREGLLTVFGQKMTHALRSSLMEKFGRLTSDNVNRQEPGMLVSRFVGDVDTVENLFTSGIVSMFADACKIISILAVIWFRNRGLTFVLLVLLPFLFWFTRHVQKNMRTIHCLKKEAYMEEQYDIYIGRSYQAMERTNFYDAIYSPVILTLNAAVVAVVMLLSASGNKNVLMLFGMSAGTAVAVINYISQIFTPVESLGMEIQTIQSAIAGIHRINEFFALEERTENLAWQMKQVDTDRTPLPFVEFKDVTFGYDEHTVLQHLSFSVMDGEQVTLAGRTGAGKSTILRLLLGLYEPQSGAVLIHGVPAVAIPDEKRRRMFGYVEQSFHMVPGTVRDQITLYDTTISDEAAQMAARLTGLDETIRELEKGYDTICTPELFSQGQWQLLSIARAAAANPRMLLLDEITANLDAKTEAAVLDALERVANHRTVISISHRTSARLGRVIQIEAN